MCHFEVDKKDRHLGHMDPLLEEGLLEDAGDKFVATPLGRLFIRIVAASFDQYLLHGKFSSAV
jgi:coproporphyrinogen III oxidase-like Fe-S oxidoreductase